MDESKVGGARVHAFRGDALGEHDAVAIAQLIQRGEISAAEVCEAAIARAQQVETLGGVQFAAFASARTQTQKPLQGVFAGVPTFVKDNVDVAGMPTCHGSAAVPPRPAARDGVFARQYLAQGFVVLGKSRLPEFGFNASTEFKGGVTPTRNPWNTAYSSGASSGGSAALVAAGVVPIAHANDGGGSIRIPAACCGLIGLKPTRGRFVDGESARSLPVNIVSEGVVTRSVRDTAQFVAGMEQTWRNNRLPAVGLVEGPGKVRLRIGLVYESINGHPIDAATRTAVQRTAALLESAGHRLEPLPLQVSSKFPEDFALYWGMLAFLVSRFGRHVINPEFDATRIDNLSRGLAAMYARRIAATPAMLFRLRRSTHDYVQILKKYDAVLTPVLAHAPPQLGHLSPDLPFETLFERLLQYVAFTPLNNATGSPAISLPMGQSPEGLPIGVQLMAQHGAERTLLELAFELEQVQPWRRISAANY